MLLPMRDLDSVALSIFGSRPDCVRIVHQAWCITFVHKVLKETVSVLRPVLAPSNFDANGKS